MRALLLGISVIAAGWAQDSLELHDPPTFKKGQFAESTDAGVHASAATAAKVRPVAPVEADLRRAYTAQPKSFDAVLALGQFLMESGRGPEAQPFLAEAQTLLADLRNHAAPATVLHMEARLLAASGKPGPAAERFQKAAEAEPSETHLFDWGNHMLTHGAAEPAGKIFGYASGRFPKSARLKVAQGVAHYAQGEFDQAVRAMCAGVDLDPPDLRPLVFLGQMIDVSPDRNGEVVKRLEGFAKLYPENAQAQYFYGLGLLKQENGSAAEPYLQRASKLDPQMPEPHLELGKLFADSGREAEAIVELQSALRLSPGLDAAHYKLGLLYRRAGKSDISARHFAEYRKIRAGKAAQEEQERKQRVRLTAKP